jgi:protein-tyrosine-phosphatase
MKVLFLCKGNVGRSQIAEELFRKKFGSEHEVLSAGLQLSGPEQPIGDLLPGIKEVLEVMSEEGVDVSKNIRKQITEKMVSDTDKVVVIIEDDVVLPDYISNSGKCIRWNIPDPKGHDLEFTRNVRDMIKEKINQWTM